LLEYKFITVEDDPNCSAWLLTFYGHNQAVCITSRVSARAVRDVGGGEVDHQQTTVGVGGDMSFASNDLLASIITSCFRFREP
jgi:hypothetical protein